MKKFVNYAFIYAIFAMAGGVFYREFTKFCGFTAQTTLSVVHTHYFILGMLFFIVLGLVEKNIHFMDHKTNRAVIGYHVGLNLTAIMLFVRGILQVTTADTLSHGMDAAISGIAGIGCQRPVNLTIQSPVKTTNFSPIKKANTSDDFQ